MKSDGFSEHTNYTYLIYLELPVVFAGATDEWYMTRGKLITLTASKIGFFDVIRRLKITLVCGRFRATTSLKHDCDDRPPTVIVHRYVI